MPTLKETKGRIASVKSTLKITSAMKLVASAKLRKAQGAIASMRPYSEQLQGILSRLLAATAVPKTGTSATKSAPDAADVPEAGTTPPVAIVAVSSNSSLCGAFNANVIRKVKDLLQVYPDATVFSIGRKVADTLRKAGFPSPEDYNALSEHPAYAPAATLSRSLREAFDAGRYSKVLLVYNHFVSTSRQETFAETFLPASVTEAPETGLVVTPASPGSDYILEPSPAALLSELYPKVLDLRFFTALLDSAAAEHAARTIAMQMATDNAEELLDDLTLQYNKSRQQKITSEILDLASGAAQ